jgi:N utilization substance protein A
VGVRGNRIKNIVDELSGERIDIVRYSDDLQELIPNALQPAEVEEVILCKMMGRAIVLVREDQLSLAIGRRGQNVRLASKLCGWDIEIMTREELEEQIDRAVGGFGSLEGVTEELAEQLVGEGFLSYDDLSVIEPEDLMDMGNLTAEEVDVIVEQAERKAEEAEQAAAEQRRRQREQERLERAAAEAQAREAAQQSQTEAPTPEREPSGEPSAPGGASDEVPQQDASATQPIDEADVMRAPAGVEAQEAVEQNPVEGPASEGDAGEEAQQDASATDAGGKISTVQGESARQTEPSAATTAAEQVVEQADAVAQRWPDLVSRQNGEADSETGNHAEQAAREETPQTGQAK